MIASALSQLPGSEGRLEDELVAFGRTFLSVLFSPGVVSSMNRHIDLLARTPSLAKRFYDAGPGQTRARLAAFLTVSVGEERMPAEQAIDAASDLMSLWVGDKQQQLALGLLDPLSPDEIQRHVRRCTQLFIRAYGLRPGRAAAQTSIPIYVCVCVRRSFGCNARSLPRLKVRRLCDAPLGTLQPTPIGRGAPPPPALWQEISARQHSMSDKLPIWCACTPASETALIAIGSNT